MIQDTEKLTRKGEVLTMATVCSNTHIIISASVSIDPEYSLNISVDCLKKKKEDTL